MNSRWPFIVACVSALFVGLLVVAEWMYPTYGYHPVPQSVTLSSLALISFLAVAFAIALVGFSRTTGYANLSRSLIRIKP